MGWGILFFVLLAGLWFYLKWAAEAPHLSPHDLGLFFTFFVLIQFWNLFNVSVLGTSQSIFKQIRHSWGLLGVAAAILIGQILIVNFGGSVFRTIPLSGSDWFHIIIGTSVVLWIGELWRLFSRLYSKRKK